MKQRSCFIAEIEQVTFYLRPLFPYFLTRMAHRFLSTIGPGDYPGRNSDESNSIKQSRRSITEARQVRITPPTGFF